MNPKFCTGPRPGESLKFEHRFSFANPARRDVSDPFLSHGPDARRTGHGRERRAIEARSRQERDPG